VAGFGVQGASVIGVVVVRDIVVGAWVVGAGVELPCGGGVGVVGPPWPMGGENKWGLQRCQCGRGAGVGQIPGCFGRLVVLRNSC